VKRYASPESYDKLMSAAATNGEAKDSAQKNGHHKKGGD